MNSQLREDRIERMRHMKKVNKMSLRAIGKLENISGSRVSQLIGNTGPSRPYLPHLLEVYRFIERHCEKYKYSPSYAEISREFPAASGEPTSASVVSGWIRRMTELGMIAPRPKMIARSIVPLPLNKKKAEIREMLRIENKENHEHTT